LFCIFGGFSRASAESTSAADTREQFAALAPFQRFQPNQPPCKSVNSAASPVLPARHFSGKFAISATYAIFATAITF